MKWMTKSTRAVCEIRRGVKKVDWPLPQQAPDICRLDEMAVWLHDINQGEGRTGVGVGGWGRCLFGHDAMYWCCTSKAVSSVVSLALWHSVQWVGASRTDQVTWDCFRATNALCDHWPGELSYIPFTQSVTVYWLWVNITSLSSFKTGCCSLLVNFEQESKGCDDGTTAIND